MGIFVSHANRAVRDSRRMTDADADMPLTTKRLRGLDSSGQATRSEDTESSESAENVTTIVSRHGKRVPKPTLSDLSGVRPTDEPNDDERPKRDRPRLAFRPFHALIAILTLSCALCASLTMLVQQAVHYSALQRSQTVRSQERETQQPQQPPQQSPQLREQSQPAQEAPTTQNPAEQPNQIDLNAAGLTELQTLKGVGPVTAQRILDYRNRIGRFENVDQLLEVKGIGTKTLSKFRDQVCVR